MFLWFLDLSWLKARREQKRELRLNSCSILDRKEKEFRSVEIDRGRQFLHNRRGKHKNMASSTVEQVQFPLLNHWADYIYRPCTIPYRFPSDPPHQATRTEVLWLEVFRKSIPSFRSGFFLILLLFPAVGFPLLQMVLINCAEFLEGGNNNV